MWISADRLAKPKRIKKVVSCCGLVTAAFLLAGEPIDCRAGDMQFTEQSDPFDVGRPVPQQGWVDAPGVTAESWIPVDQQDLEQALQAAPQLPVLDVAPGPRRVSQGHLPYFCPNPDGKSWDIIHPYHKNYLSEGQVFVYDFGSGTRRMFRYGTTAGPGVITTCNTDFHMKSSFYLAKKLIFPLSTRQHGLLWLVYDPAVNDFVSQTTPFDGGFDLYALDVGADNRLYGFGQSAARDGFLPFVFDPATYETRVYDRMGPGQQAPFPYYRDSVMHGDWMYCKFGHEPWHLVAFNFRTGEYRHLATTQEIKGDHATIGLRRHPGGVSGHVKQAVHIEGLATFDRQSFECWLVDGNILSRTDEIAPWSDEPAKAWPRLQHRFREFQRWPADFSYSVPPPEIQLDSSGPMDAEGNVAMPYRLAGDEQWKLLQYQIALYPGIVRRVIEINEQTLFAVDEGYGQHVFYDLAGKRLKRYLVQRVSPYAVGVVQDRVFVSGYPLFVTVEYELPHLATTRAPKLLGSLGAESDTHTPLAGLAGGADGCVYVAGTTVGRRRDGGGLAWYNLSNGRAGSVTMIDHRVFWLTTAAQGKYLLLSTKTDKGSRIFCWDTLQQRFIYDIASPTGGHAGPLEEALPGLVIGHAAADEGGLLYALEAASGRLLWRKTVPVGPITAFAQVRRHAYTFRRGPDGFIWASFGDALVRIDPRDARVMPVGKTAAAQIAFAGHEVYLAGGDCLRRIEGLSPLKPNRPDSTSVIDQINGACRSCDTWQCRSARPGSGQAENLDATGRVAADRDATRR